MISNASTFFLNVFFAKQFFQQILGSGITLFSGHAWPCHLRLASLLADALEIRTARLHILPVSEEILSRLRFLAPGMAIFFLGKDDWIHKMAIGTDATH